MMKKSVIRGLLICSFTAALLRLGASRVSASEGVVNLRDGGAGAECYAASVLVSEGNWKIVLTCRNLIVPPEAETLYYHAWARRVGAPTGAPQKSSLVFSRGSYFSLGDITSGKLSASSREPFEEIIVTSESSGDAREPNLDKILLSGLVEPIPFRESGIRLPSPTTEPVTAAATPTPPSTAAHPSAVGTALKIFLTVVGIIVAIAIAISVIQRRSASR